MYGQSTRTKTDRAGHCREMAASGGSTLFSKCLLYYTSLLPRKVFNKESLNLKNLCSQRWFPVHSVKSQNTNVFKFILYRVNRCYWLRTTHPSLRPSKLIFHWFLQPWSCSIKWHEKEQSRKFWPLCIDDDGYFETLNLLHVRSCKMFTFCNVLHEIKQKTQSNSRECAVLVWTGNHL